MRFKKYKIKELGKIERHNNNRSHLKTRVHPDLEKYNKTKKRFPDETLTKSIRKVIKNIKAKTGITTRKDAAVIAEFVLTYSPEATESILKNNTEWVRANIKWLQKEFESKGAKILRIDQHYDESTPHLHAFVQMTDNRGLFCANKFFGKIKNLENYQTSYAKAMEPFGLKRGISKKETKARHNDLDMFYRQNVKKLKKQLSKLKEKEQKIIEKEKLIDEKDRELNVQLQLLKEKENDIKTKIKIIEEQEKRIKNQLDRNRDLADDIFDDVVNFKRPLNLNKLHIDEDIHDDEPER